MRGRSCVSVTHLQEAVVPFRGMISTGAVERLPEYSFRTAIQLLSCGLWDTNHDGSFVCALFRGYVLSASCDEHGPSLGKARASGSVR